MRYFIAQNEINFNELKDAIPGLKPQFKQGASGVYPLLSTLLGYVYVVAGLILLFALISGGFQMMLGASDEKGLIASKAKITNALVGFLILFLSYWIIQIVEYVLGVKFF